MLSLFQGGMRKRFCPEFDLPYSGKSSPACLSLQAKRELLRSCHENCAYPGFRARLAIKIRKAVRADKALGGIKVRSDCMVSEKG
jgi:hypothetical protein